MYKKDKEKPIADMKRLIEDIREKKKEGDYLIYWYTDDTYVYGIINNTFRSRDLLQMF